MKDKDNPGQDIQLDFVTEGVEQGADEDDDSTEANGGGLLDFAHPEQQESSTVTIEGEEFELVPAEQAGDDCDHCGALKSRVEELEQKNEKYLNMLEKVEQQRSDELQSKITSLNEEVPEQSQYSEDELEDMFDGDNVAELRQTASVMERLVPAASTTEVSQGSEDLSGSAATDDNENDETEEKIDNISQSLFGGSFEDKMKSIEEKHNEGED